MSVRVTTVLPALLPARDDHGLERAQRIAAGTTRRAGEHRTRSFDRGDEPLQAYSWPRPRLTGWEREWQT